MFVILPVFALHAQGRPGWTLTLVGVALGAYGLTQAALQFPFGWLSDRRGRKPVIYLGLAILALGSFVCAAAESPWMVILGRVLQGAGAISATVIALAADQPIVAAAAFSGTAGELRFQVVQGDALLQGDVNGDQIADFYIRVEGVTQLFVGDFGL